MCLFSKENIVGQSCAEPEYSDRFIQLGGEDELIEFCFGTCGNGHRGLCSDHISIPVTFNVDMSLAESDGMAFIAGGGVFEGPGDFPMTLVTGSIYTYTTNLYHNTVVHYTFLSSDSLDWSGKEDISGQECAFGKIYLYTKDSFSF